MRVTDCCHPTNVLGTPNSVPGNLVMEDHARSRANLATRDAGIHYQTTRYRIQSTEYVGWKGTRQLPTPPPFAILP